MVRPSGLPLDRGDEHASVSVDRPRDRAVVGIAGAGANPRTDGRSGAAATARSAPEPTAAGRGAKSIRTGATRSVATTTGAASRPAGRLAGRRVAQAGGQL